MNGWCSANNHSDSEEEGPHRSGFFVPWGQGFSASSYISSPAITALNPRHSASTVSANTVEEPTDALHLQQPTDQDRSDDRIDSYIATALRDLSLRERDNVYHELHGVEEPIAESFDFIESQLQQFQSELQVLLRRLPSKRIHAYQLALAEWPEYVHNRSFRIMFLRADRFDPARAADRFLRYFDLKCHLFGRDKLGKDIELRDLNAEDMKTLKAGFMQVLPTRDRAGRAICMLLPNHQTYEDYLNFTRVMYYLLMSVVQDEETQIKGITTIVYSVTGDFVEGKTDLRTVTAGPWIQRSLPFRMCSLHQCFNDPAVRVIINFSLRFLHEKDRARVKLHCGSNVECIYALMTFGIPPEPIPVTNDGKLKRKNHAEWIKSRQYQEEHMPYGSPTIIIVPSQNDVLFGRGKPFREHVGNLRLNTVLDEKLPLYEASRMKEKTAIIGGIVDLIRTEHGRFLKQDPHSPWIEVDDKQAKEKVSHGFRTRIRIASAATPRSSCIKLPISTRSSEDGFNSMCQFSGHRRSYTSLAASSSASETESNDTSSPHQSPMTSPFYRPDEIVSTIDENVVDIGNSLVKRARL